jgi:type II secretory pathway component GspD/PulD (secretin)
MIRIALFLIAFLPVAVCAAPVSLNLQAVSLRELVRIVYEEVNRKSYVVDTSVLADDSLVSLHIHDQQPEQIEHQLRQLLESRGYQAEVSRGVVHIRKKTEPQPGEGELFVYAPKHRSARYLVELCSPLFRPGSFVNQRGSGMNIGQITGVGVQPVQSMATAQPIQPGQQQYQPPVAANTASMGVNALADQDIDSVIFRGQASEVEKLKGLLVQIDQRALEVMVKAVVYEVNTAQHEGSAVDLALSIISGKLGLKISSGSITADSGGLSVKLPGVDTDFSAFWSALSSDDRFHVVTSPRLRVRSGSSARFSVGSDVPILGSVSYDNNGKPIQNVTYKPAGIIFNVRPSIRSDSSELNITQQISQFVPTTTGVNSTPTLVKRELATDIVAKDDEIILLGGLDEDRNTASDHGLSFLPRFARASSSDKSKTEIVLMLHVKRV